MFEGKLKLIEDGGKTVLHAGDCAAFPNSAGNGHHLVNQSSAVAEYMEVGFHHPQDITTCSDIDDEFQL